MLGVLGSAVPSGARLLLQAGNAPNGGVEVPIFPALMAIAGLTAVIILSVSALQRARPQVTLRRRPEGPSPKESFLPVESTIQAAPAAVYRKAPLAIHFPMIKGGFPDVWGIGERAPIVFKIEDRGLLGQRQIAGLSATVGSEPVPLIFFRGEARVERTFASPGEIEVAVELRVRGERLQRRTSRVLKIVNYREEIAEVFDSFKGRVSRTITPLRVDATPWEIYDAIRDANPNLNQVRLREIVAGFEEAKFSNHPVGRATYERVLSAARELQLAEA